MVFRMLSDEQRQVILEDAVARDMAVRGGTVEYGKDFHATITRGRWFKRRSRYKVDPAGALLTGSPPSRFVH